MKCKVLIFLITFIGNFIGRTNLLVAQNSNQFNASTSFISYKPVFGTITFDYPSSWEVGKNDNKTQAYNENYFTQPKNQEFSAQNGQVVIRIFDPVSIMEDTKSLNAKFSQSLFEKFVKGITEGANFVIRTVNQDQRSFFECTQQNDGFVVRMVGAKSESGNLYVVAMAIAPGIDSENNAILYRVAKSIRGAEPNPYLTKQEAAIKKWYTALGAANAEELRNLSCQSASGAESLLSLIQKLFGTSNTRDFIISAASSFDFSNLGFYTVGGNANLAVIRVCGNMVAPNGDIKSFYNYSRSSGGTNLYVVRLESGEWKICERVNSR
jgi:hypothetical protein